LHLTTLKHTFLPKKEDDKTEFIHARNVGAGMIKDPIFSIKEFAKFARTTRDTITVSIFMVLLYFRMAKEGEP
jgi:hypothetical protein